ncbi:MAG: YitT family protein [Lachnospiraceae bacterium]|nr:YitT family protein [Lachnospiraceae bacterium]
MKLKTIFMVLLGSFLYSLTVKLFLIPANLMSGGATGIALMFEHLTGFSMSAFILIFNIFALILGLFLLGKKFVATTILSSLFYPVALEFLNRILGDLVITENVLLNTVFAGLGIGLSLGIVMREGSSTGGMDIPCMILNKYFRIPLSISVYVIDFVIIAAQMYYHPLEDMLYGIILLLLTSIALDKTTLIGSTKTQVKILSSKTEDLKAAIISEIDRGVTLLKSRGGYLNQESELLLSVVSNREFVKVQRLVRLIDPECFMIVSRVTEVHGNGFSFNKDEG